MANPFVKAWKYLMASFSSKVDEHADPKVQIQQAIEEAQRQHQALSQQAASVIGNQRQLEMKLNRQLSEVERLQSSAQQAVTMAEQARAEGDEQKAQRYEETAQQLANQLVGAEEEVENLKKLHEQSAQAAEQAKQAVDRNQQLLQKKTAERTKLLSQLEQAKMQEQVSASLQQMNQTQGSDSPSLEDVRDKIEQRYSTALGQAELAGDSPQGRMREVEEAAADAKGANRLAQLRASMQGGQQQVTGGSSQQQLTGGEQSSETAAQQQDPKNG